MSTRQNRIQDPTVTVILVNWNGRSFLGRCLRAVFASTYPRLDVLLVDNASTDGSIRYVERNFPHVRILRNEENLGFAGGHEIARPQVRSPLILLLNTDAFLERTCIASLVNMLQQDPRIGVVQPKIVMDNHPDRIDSVGAFFIPNGNLYHYGREKNPDSPAYNRRMDIFTAKGVCLLFRKTLIDQIGLFDPDYGSYFEETDFCLRTHIAGKRIVYNPEAVVFHVGGASSGQQPGDYVLFHAEKNRIMTYLKNFSASTLTGLLPRLIILYALGMLMYLVMGKFGHLGALVRSIVWNIRHLGGTLRKRKRIQDTIRTVPDAAFLPQVTRRVGLEYHWYQIVGGMEKYRDRIQTS